MAVIRRRQLFDFIDGILLMIVVILALSLARIVLDGDAQAVVLITPVTIEPFLPAAQAMTETPLPPTATASATPTLTPQPTATAVPSLTPTPTPTVVPTVSPPPLNGVYVPSVTPKTAAVNGTPVPPPVPPVPLPPGSITIALLGSDKRPNRGDYRTDTIILVNVNPQAPSVTMLSIPRDLYVYIPGAQFNKINTADEYGEFMRFPGGGAALIKQTIEYNLGVHVDYYARVDFAGFMKIIDRLGGVDVIANCPLEDVFPADPITEDKSKTAEISIKPGVVHLDGRQALWYSRSRENTSDFDRSLRQQRVLRAIYAKATSLDLIPRLPELWSDLTATVTTDLKLNDLIWLASIAARLDSTRLKGRVLDGSVLYNWTTPDTHAWVVSPIPDKIGLVLAEVFNPPTNIAAQAPVRVEVWNGTANPAWGILGADRLEWENYVAANIAPADRNDYAQTKIVDLTTTTKGSRRSQLASLFRVSAANIISQPDANSPVAYRIIVGADFQPCSRPSLPIISATPTATPTATPAP